MTPEALDPGMFQDLAHQAPVLALFVVSGFLVLRLFLSHLKTEGTEMRKVLASVVAEMKENTVAMTGLTEVVRGMQQNEKAMGHLLEVIKGIKGDG